MTKDEALRLALEAMKVSNSAWKSLADSGDAGFWKAEEQGYYQLNEQAITAVEAALEAKDGCQCPACKVAPHASDCAVHNEPAYPAGECNCGATGKPVGYWQGEFIKDGWATLYEVPQESVFGRKYRNIPLYSAPQKQPPVIDKSVARRVATQLGWEPPRKPLTDEEIKQCGVAVPFDGKPDWSLRFARAIEAAHGIIDPTDLKGEA